MQSPDNTEMERLLRRHARRRGEALRATRGDVAEATGAHLDADELNAYAEGALPEATRTRYFTHLADCDTCRKLVTDLALAAGVASEAVARPLAADAQPSKSWCEWLRALLSPPVLRYAVPALALFAVVIVAIVMMRSQREAGSVAQRTDESRYSTPAGAADSNATANTATATGTAENHSNSSNAPLVDQPSPMQPGLAETPELAKAAPTQTDAQPVPQATPTNSPVLRTDDAKDVEREAKQPGERARQEVMDAAPPPPVTMAAPAAEPSDRDKREEQRKAKAGKDDEDEVVADGSIAGAANQNKMESNEDRSEVGRTTINPRAVQSLPRRSAPAAKASGGAAASRAAEKEASAETRSVGGRRFRRDGGAWVDTAYNPSRSTTNVRRGSEHYRSLLADEPTLRTITEQLDGEVIVVWKSRAYRFY